MKDAWMLALALPLVAVGCRTNPNQMLIERELRHQEDKIWQLTFEVEDLRRQLEECQRAEASRPAAADRASPGPLLPLIPRPPASDRPDPGPPPSRPGGVEPPRIDLPTGPPQIDLGDPTDPNRLPPPDESMRGPADGAGMPELIPGGVRAAVSDPIISRLDIGASTGVFGGSTPSSSSGLDVALEARDVLGQLVQVPGEVSIVVIDPQLSGPAARVARWDFTAEQIGRQFHGNQRHGLHFRLPWSEQAPQHDQLRLFVRYTTPDGHRIEADRWISGPAHAPPAGQWTQSTRGEARAEQSAAEGARGDATAERRGPLRTALQPRVEPGQSATDGAPRRRPVWSPQR
jgi:hypothetical protein